MSALPLPTDSPAEPLRFSVEDYYRLAEVGILEPDARVELLDGEVLRMSPMGSRHARQTTWINTLFGRTLGTRCWVACQVPLRLNDFSEPEPDLMLLRDQDGLYRAQQPSPDDAHLVVEVSDSSLAFDREVKLPLYAASGVVEVWIVDLAADRLRVYRRPSGREYGETHILGAEDTVTPVAFPDVAFQVADLIG